MERKLASIQIIDALEPIPDADRIVRAKVMGWNVVVRKGEFKEGDRCVFFEIDAVLRAGDPWAEFMRPRKFRVKTCKLRGALSQGLALPIGILPEKLLVACTVEDTSPSYTNVASTEFVAENPREYAVGTDVAHILGVKKHIVPEHYGGAKMGTSAGSFPSHLAHRTDEIRIQSALEVLEELKGNPFYVAVKCDGTSGTFVHDGVEFYACSRNFRKKQDDTNVYWQVVRRYNLREKLKEVPFFVVQGEICGPGIQANRLMLKEIDLFVFDVYDSKAGRYLDYHEFIEFCKDHELQTVPIERVVEGDELKSFDHSLGAWLERARGKYEGTRRNREGIVVRPLTGMHSQTLEGRLSFKVINNDFLLKDEK